MRFSSFILLPALLAATPASAQDAPFACPDGATMVELAANEAAPSGTRVVKRAAANANGTSRACLGDASGAPLGRDALTMIGVTTITAGLTIAVVASDDDRPISR